MTQDPATTVPRAPAAGTDDEASAEAARAYQRERLWAGIAGIGAMVVGVAAAALLGADDLLDGLAAGPAPVAGGVVGLVLGAVAAVVLAPVDRWAGVGVERRHGMGGTEGWGRRYAAGVLVWVAAVGAGGALVGAATLAGDAWWAVHAAMTVVVIPAAVWVADAAGARTGAPAPAAMRSALAEDLAPLGIDVPDIRITGDPGRSLDGGWAGGTLLLSASCRDLAGTPHLACLVAREVGHRRRRDRARGVAVAAAWTAAAPALAALVFAPDPSDVAAVVLATAAASTVWAWIGLLVLPTLGRRQVYAADRFWLRSGGDADVLRQTIMLLADRNLGDRSRPVWVERVFHPVPSVENRLRAIATGRTP